MLSRIRKRKKSKGQSTLEYAVLIVVLIGAMMAAQQYFRRAVMGRFKQSSDDISDTQFDPGSTQITRVVSTRSETNEISRGGVTTTLMINPEVTNTTVNMHLFYSPYADD